MEAASRKEGQTQASSRGLTSFGKRSSMTLEDSVRRHRLAILQRAALLGRRRMRAHVEAQRPGDLICLVAFYIGKWTCPGFGVPR